MRASNDSSAYPLTKKVSQKRRLVLLLIATVMLQRLDDWLKLPRPTMMMESKAVLVMFTDEQINVLQARLGSAKTLPEYVRALKALGHRTVRSCLAAIRNTSGRAARGSSRHRCTRCLLSRKPVNARR
jgi:hypothetical protein